MKNHDDIIRMAREAGINLTPAQFSGVLEDEVDEFKLAVFAALVAAAEREAWRNALQPVFQTRMGAEQVREAVQAAIRARGAA